MAAPLEQTMRSLHRWIGKPEVLADKQLLSRYVVSKDETAFAALVERHGAMVLGVCRRVLTHAQDAEDACQAAFLVLARKARSINKRESIRCWLHGVAFRVASNLRRQQSRLRAEPLVEPAAPAEDMSWREVRRVLDEEMLRLPENIRLPLLLCYLEGKTRDEAAALLGWSLTTFKGRLERGREQLRVRLQRRGIGLSAALLATLLFQGATQGAVPSALQEMIVRSTGGMVSSSVNRLVEGVLRSMFVKQMQLLLGIVLVLGALATGALFFQGPAAAETAVVTEEPIEVPAKDSPKEDAAKDKAFADQIKNSRQAAIDWFKKSQGGDGTWENTDLKIGFPGGQTCLAVLALLDSGVNPGDPALVKAMKHVRSIEPKQTYIVALQTAALCRANSLKDAKQIKRNVDWLVDNAVRDATTKQLKGWSYPLNEGRADFSNTQYAILALHAASRVNIKPKNEKFWNEVRDLYVSCQTQDGGWAYTTNFAEPTHSMTCAGLCGVMIADEEIGEPSHLSRKACELGLTWLAKHFTPESAGGSFYNLHTIGRLGKLSGKRTIGEHDWYRDGARWLLKAQRPDGSFEGRTGMDRMKVISTAFALLFLNSELPEEAKPAAPKKVKPAEDKKTKAYLDNVDTFLLRLEFSQSLLQAEPKLDLRTLVLHVADLRFTNAPSPDGKPLFANARISKEQARKIIDVLTKQEFFEPKDPRLPGESKVNHAVFSVHTGKEQQGDETSVRYFWNDELLEMLKAIRSCVDGDAAQNVDLLIQPLASDLKKLKP